MKKQLEKLLAFFGLKLTIINSKVNTDEINTDPFALQQYLTKDSKEALIIFDIGAFDGLTALHYNKNFPGSQIFSFEPFPESYDKLVKSVSKYKNIVTTNKGIGEKEGTAHFNSNDSAPTNSLLDTDELSESTWGTGLVNTKSKIEVELTTIDNFVKAHKIEKIDILKMDVQGAEYMVMNGAKNSIEKGVINIIYTEIITLPTYKGQLTLDEMIKLMRTFGFSLYNLYNFSFTEEGRLRQVDAIFLKS